MSDRHDLPEDLAALGRSETLLAALGNGDAVTDADQLGRVLGAWRQELDAVEATPLPSRIGGTRRWVRAHRNIAGATAIVLALAASTGVAAAVSGPTGPFGGLHKALVGGPSHHVDVIARQVARDLDAIRHFIDAHASGVSDRARQTQFTKLAAARALLATDPEPPDRLRERIDELNHDLAALPALPAPTDDSTTTDRHGSNSGSDDTDADDHGGTSGHGSDDGDEDGEGSGDDGSGASGSGDDSQTGDRDGDGGDDSDESVSGDSNSGDSDSGDSDSGDSVSGDSSDGGDDSVTSDSGDGGGDSVTSGSSESDGFGDGGSGED